MKIEDAIRPVSFALKGQLFSPDTIITLRALLKQESSVSHFRIHIVRSLPPEVELPPALVAPATFCALVALAFRARS